MNARDLAADWLAMLVDPQPETDVKTPQNSLTEYKRQIYSRYTHAPHLDLLDEKLEQMARYVETGGKEGIGRLIIAMPPRHGKTLTTSRLFPTWFLGRNPDKRVMLVSYGQGLSNKNSRVARNIIKSKQYGALFPKTRLADDSQSVQEWNIANTHDEGGADAIGIGGGATGKGAHVLIIDDPVKNREQAESITYRNKIWDAYTDDLLTRLEPGGAVIVMATRWHEDDLTGRLIKNEADKWDVVNLPALAHEDDPLGRAVGEALWPDRFNTDALNDKKDSMGEYSWASLYDQSPRPATGGIIKRAWFRRIRVLPEAINQVRYWDLAMSENTNADYTVGLKMQEDKRHDLQISDIARGQVELHQLPAFIKDVILADGPKVVQGFEMKGYMTRAVKQLARDPELRGYKIKGYNVETDKLTRVLPAAARASMDVIQMYEAEWTDACLDEFAAFPYGSNDDQVDGFSGAYQMLDEGINKGSGITVGTSNYA